MIKRNLDLFISTFCIIVLLPLIVIIALLILLESGRPVFFIQKRVGKNKNLFNMYKFRSMRVNNIDPFQLGPIKHSHQLVTKVGYFIRRTKLDELPQLLNVIRCEMSLVGPRPCLPERLDQMNHDECRRFDALPGITGWAEVNGNLELDWNEQLLLDLWYINNQSTQLDLKILIKTFFVLILGSIRNEKALNLAKKTRFT